MKNTYSNCNAASTHLMSLFVVIIIHRKQVTDRFLAAVAPAFFIFGLASFVSVAYFRLKLVYWVNWISKHV